MHAESAEKFEAVEQLSGNLRLLFAEAGYELVAPSILQPAELFFDALGEQVRARTYVFNDLDGHELCLRPDLTVPTARIYLQRHEKLHDAARYCYSGPVFRYAPVGGDETNRRELRQTGLELYAANDAEKAEAEILRLTVDGLNAVGLTDFDIKIGDLKLFNTLLDAIDMPERWRQRLKHHFSNSEKFIETLHNLARSKDERLAAHGKWPRLDPDRPKLAEEILANYLVDNKIPVIGVRSLTEITSRLLEFEADMREKPLSERKVKLIEAYLKINDARPLVAMARLGDLCDGADLDMTSVISSFKRRLRLFDEEGVPIDNIMFSAVFGRAMEYYTGFVFQIFSRQIPELEHLCSGGSYDHLLQDLRPDRKPGKPIPAVGCAIMTETLLTAVEGELV